MMMSIFNSCVLALKLLVHEQNARFLVAISIAQESNTTTQKGMNFMILYFLEPQTLQKFILLQDCNSLTPIGIIHEMAPILFQPTSYRTYW